MQNDWKIVCPHCGEKNTKFKFVFSDAPCARCGIKIRTNIPIVLGGAGTILLAVFLYIAGFFEGGLEWPILAVGWVVIGLLLIRLYGRALKGDEVP